MPHSSCIDGCGPFNSDGLKVGALIGTGFFVVGTAVGALAGHEDRYVLRPR
jgi:hypothetical protein